MFKIVYRIYVLKDQLVYQHCLFFQDQMALKETLIRMATKLNIAPEPLYREELTYPPELVMDANFILLLNSKYNSLGNKTKTTLTEWDNQSSVEGEVVYKNGLTARPR